MLEVIEQKIAAKKFVEYWTNKGDEKQDTQSFWIHLLYDVYGVENATQYINFEKRVNVDGSTRYIDGYIGESKVLIEQKSLGIDLDKPEKQSGGAMLTPFAQAKRYANELPVTEHPKWIIISDFKSFRIYNMNSMTPERDVSEVQLKNLPIEFSRMTFLANEKEERTNKELEVSLDAGRLVGLIYDELIKQYKEPESEEAHHSLNVLCVRLVFCLYAEDAGLFGAKNLFHDYLAQFESRNARKALVELFKVLNQKEEDRDPFLADDDKLLAAFPYVNGGLFADEEIIIPPLNDRILDVILSDMSSEFDWADISPTIFGAVFESTLNPETRRKGGMHYTSIENIHKVIDPLFLNEIKEELVEAKSIDVAKKRKEKLEFLQDKISSIIFLDPAAGSGNFLTETYLSLRKIENEILDELLGKQIVLLEGAGNPIKVSINQFYGIEINDFAVTVAKTAMWIAEAQMLEKTQELLSFTIDFFPLKSYVNMIEGNALKMDWDEVVPKEKLNYIMGNPPFIGASLMTKEQKKDAVDVYGKIKLANSIDYVGAWYHLAAKLMQDTNIKAALVSTNSITQGEQVYPLWDKLLTEYNIEIDFAYRTFIWNSEASLKAHVHCVIIGFSTKRSVKGKYLYDGETKKLVHNISPYLLPTDNILVQSRSKPLCDVSVVTKGNQPTDGGNFILSTEEKDEIIKNNPGIEKFIYKFIGSEELIHKKTRWCFWLKNAAPNELKQYPEIIKRIENIRELRLKSSAAPTRKKAETPHLFFSQTQPENDYIMIPRVSSEKRRYVPIVLMSKDVIASDACSITTEATMYDFGILISNIHMAWMRTVAGRLEMRYRYSGNVVYNTFPWPIPTEEQTKAIENTAQAILDARELYPESSLADMYGEQMYLYTELVEAHRNNDKAVMAAYGLNVRTTTEEDCVTFLMEKYQELTNK